MLKATGIILVLSCRAHRDTRQKAVLETWGSSLPDGWQILVIEGGDHKEARIEGRFLHVPVQDDYNHLAEKTFRAIEFLCQHAEFEGLLKCDDDTYVHLGRFLKGFDLRIPYAGNSADTLKGRNPYAQGGAYWLSRATCQLLVSSPFSSYRDHDWFLGGMPLRKRGEQHARAMASIEDLMVGDILRDKGVSLHQDDRFNPDPFPSVHERKNLFSSHHVCPKTMRLIHRQRVWLNHPLKRFLVPLVKYLPSSKKPR